MISEPRKQVTSMILDRLPDQPSKRNTGLKFLGYWAAEPGTSTAKEYAVDFPEGLPRPQDFVDTTWNAQERDLVIQYLQKGETRDGWFGYARCRYKSCGSQLDGSRDLTDGVYVWPESFPHYLSVHGVKPPQEFIDHVKKHPPSWLPTGRQTAHGATRSPTEPSPPDPWEHENNEAGCK